MKQETKKMIVKLILSVIVIGLVVYFKIIDF